MKLLELLKKAYSLLAKALRYLGVLIGVLEKEQENSKKEGE
jgi:hypothetical protein